MSPQDKAGYSPQIQVSKVLFLHGCCSCCLKRVKSSLKIRDQNPLCIKPSIAGLPSNQKLSAFLNKDNINGCIILQRLSTLPRNQSSVYVDRNLGEAWIFFSWTNDGSWSFRTTQNLKLQHPFIVKRVETSSSSVAIFSEKMSISRIAQHCQRFPGFLVEFSILICSSQAVWSLFGTSTSSINRFRSWHCKSYKVISAIVVVVVDRRWPKYSTSDC